MLYSSQCSTHATATTPSAMRVPALVDAAAAAMGWVEETVDQELESVQRSSKSSCIPGWLAGRRLRAPRIGRGKRRAVLRKPAHETLQKAVVRIEKRRGNNVDVS